MVAQQDYVGHFQLIEDITLPKEFFGNPEVADISSVNYKVDIVALIDGFDEVFGLVIPALGVAHRNESDAIFLFAGVFNFDYVVCIDVCFSVYPDVVRMVINHVASPQQHT
ncbi:hypothetical protein EVA_07483 [gut metagenome]|uniref:Uncharacterized protein n=1 Tax=gut metagenome TaxID=749906 RepID=J9GAS1_9ZZZZ